VGGQDENGEEIVIDLNRDLAELAEKKKRRSLIQGSRLDDSGHGGSLKRALGHFARQIPILKLSKISTKPVDIFVENLSRGKSDRADLSIPSICLKYRQSPNELI